MWDGVDRRQFVRAQYPCLLVLRKQTPPPEAILTHTEDVSIGGMRVIISKKLELMAEVNVEIDLKDTLANVQTKAKVGWCKEISAPRLGRPARYDTGLKFAALKDDDRQRLQRIVEHFTSKS